MSDYPEVISFFLSVLAFCICVSELTINSLTSFSQSVFLFMNFKCLLYITH